MKLILRSAIFALVLLISRAALSETVAAQEPQAVAAAPGATAQNPADVPNAAEVIRESSQTILALLKKTRFKVAVGPDGSSSISRESDEPPPSAEIAERLQQSQAGTEQTIKGFLKSWVAFMVQSVIPAPDEKYHLVLVDGNYLLTVSDNGYDLAIDFNSNLAMERVSVKSAALNVEFKPTFENTPNGYVLVGYIATFPAPEAGGPTSADAKIENQIVDGFQLPHLVNFAVPINETTLAVHMTFSDYQVTYKLVDLK
jgi:hypothetical protein